MTLHEWTLPNGVEVVFEQIPYAQVTSFDLIVNQGQFVEKDHQRGWTHLIASMYDRGCKSFEEEKIQGIVHTHQIEFDGIMGNHFIGLEFQCPSTHWQQTMLLAKHMFENPTIEQSKLDQEVQVIVQEIEKLANDADEVITQVFFSHLFQNHPYARHAWGTKQSLEKAKSSDVHVFYQELMQGKKYLNMVGPQDPVELEKFVEKEFSNFKESKTVSQKINFEAQASTVRKETKFQKLYGALGFPLCNVQNGDRFALEWIRQYWVHALGGRLFERIREELGLVYNIDCNSSFLQYAGCMLISYAAEIDSELQIDQVLQEEITKICQEKIPQVEYQRMLKYMQGSSKIEWDPIANHVHFFNQAKIYSTSLDYKAELEQLLSVTREEIQSVANKYLMGPKTDVKLVPR